MTLRLAEGGEFLHTSVVCISVPVSIPVGFRLDIYLQAKRSGKCVEHRLFDVRRVRRVKVRDVFVLIGLLLILHVGVR